MQAIAYIRVSSKGQLDGDGPDRQRDRIKSFCQQHHLTFHCECFEQGVSGAVDGLDRPAFSDALELAKQTGACIVVEKLDRLAREVLVQEVIIRELTRFGIPLYAADSGELVDIASAAADPGRVLMRQIFAAIAQFEKALIKYRTQAAMRRKVEMNGKCAGQKAYGEEDAHEKLVLEQMRLLKQLGFGYGRICKELNSLGIMTRSGKPWRKDSVQSVMTRRDCVAPIWNKSGGASVCVISDKPNICAVPNKQKEQIA